MARQREFVWRWELLKVLFAAVFMPVLPVFSAGPSCSAPSHGWRPCARPSAAPAGPAGIGGRSRYGSPEACQPPGSVNLQPKRMHADAVSVSTDGQLSCLCDKCHQATQCYGTRCFSSIKVRSSGPVLERGCLMDLEKILMQCSTPSSTHYGIFCCSQEMCNSNTSAHSLRALLPTGGRRRRSSAPIWSVHNSDPVSSCISS